MMPGAALVFSLFEAALLIAWRNRDFANLWELQSGLLSLLPTLTLQSVAVGTAAAALFGGATSERLGARAGAALAAALAAAWLGFELTHGRHFELWWRRAGFVALLASVSAATIVWGGPLLHACRGVRSKSLALGAAGTALALLVVNRFVLVRLYPPFHLALGCLSLGAAGVAAMAWTADSPARTGEQKARHNPLWAIALTVAAVAGLVPAARFLSRLDNFRWVVTENAPLSGQAVQWAALIAPPKPLSNQESIGAPDGPVDQVVELGLQGRDLLLITVDALRADHVGAYGYTRPTTPNLDLLAAEGARFDHAYCATPHTSYSVTSLLTGKYMRPLLLQDLGGDSETWADLLRRYGYRTAAFYPPAIFFIDTERFAPFDHRQLGFEYQKREFLEGDARVAQVTQYLSSLDSAQPTFVWLHLFGPHEPYESHPEYGFGETDVDRYDSEVRATDETIGKVVRAFRERSPSGIVMVTADHGEEFGDHGGRYHGTSVYEEQVRVPLIVAIPSLAPKVISRPVQTIDLLPTTLAALDIPTRPRIRGRSLLPLLAAKASEEQDLEGTGFAFSETDTQAMIAEGSLRLVCLRRVGACQLFDVGRDPGQKQDVSRDHPQAQERLRERLRRLNSDHGQFEISGARAEGLRWPGPILRGLAGDVDAAGEIAGLLDDADVQVRRKAAEVLFSLAGSQLAPPGSDPAATAAGGARSLGSDVATPLRLAVQRDEDHDVRAYSALALTRLGEGASLTRELLESEQVDWRRKAALALAESGDKRGMKELLAWWMDKAPKAFEVSTQIIAAFARAKEKDAVWPLTLSLRDVRLRPYVVTALGAIGDDSAVNGLVAQFKREPYQSNRTLLARALLGLGAGPELAVPLRRWLGVGEPLADGLAIAQAAGVLDQVGGPSTTDLRRLNQNANLGQLIAIVVPKTGNGTGIRFLARVTNAGPEARTVRVGEPHGVFSFDSQGKLKTSRRIPELDQAKQLSLRVPPSSTPLELHAVVPPSLGLRPGKSSYVVVFAEHGVKVETVAFVPLQDELSADEGHAEPQE